MRKKLFKVIQHIKLLECNRQISQYIDAREIMEVAEHGKHMGRFETTEKVKQNVENR